MKQYDFVKYMSKPLNRDIIDLFIKEHNISIEKVDLFYDFVDTLEHIVYTTYLGDDVTDIPAKRKHFNWCWEKTVRVFYDEGLLLGDVELKSYFGNFFGEVFYNINDDDKKGVFVKGFWRKIFDIHTDKSAGDMDTLVELYKLFNRGMVNIKT